jgi:hypothetical protein
MRNNIIGYRFGTKFKLVFCAKYDRGLDLGFWEILKPLKWTNITSFFLITYKFLRPFFLKGTYSIGQLCPNLPKTYRSFNAYLL